MGSRTTWKIKTENSDQAVIHLYSHWGGESKFEDTQRALLAAEPRWSDTSYGARIFVSQIVGNHWGEETGFGISAGALDAEFFEESYYGAIIDFSAQTVTLGTMEWSFKDFVSAGDHHSELVEEFWGAGHA